MSTVERPQPKAEVRQVTGRSVTRNVKHGNDRLRGFYAGLGGMSDGLATVDVETLDPETCRELLPDFRRQLSAVGRFVNAIEHRAYERPASVCDECETRFYPSRKDARFCGGRCRTRAHRRAG